MSCLERPPGRQAVPCQRLIQAQVRRRIGGRGRVAGVEAPGADAEVVGADHERHARHADVAGHRGGAAAGCAELRGDHAEVGVFGEVGRSGVWFRGRLAREQFDRAVVVVGQFMVQRADQGEAVRLAGDPGEEFADLHTRRAGADRPERAADPLGGVGLGIERLEMARPAPHPEEDDRRVRRRRRGGGPDREQPGQAQPAQRERAGPEERAAREGGVRLSHEGASRGLLEGRHVGLRCCWPLLEHEEPAPDCSI